MKDILERASQIRLLIFDVDGVLTDGSLFVGDDGQEYKAFNSRDGHGIKMLQKHKAWRYYPRTKILRGNYSPFYRKKITLSALL